MNVKRFEIKHISTGFLDSSEIDGVCHIKELPYLSVVEPLEGSYTVTIGDGKPLTVREHEMFCAPAHIIQKIVHHISENSGRMRARWIFLDCMIDGKGSPDSLYSIPMQLAGDAANIMDDIITKIFSASLDFDIFSFCCKAVGHLVSISKPKNTREKRSDAAVKYIQTHYAEDVTPEELAKLLYVSVPRLYAIFAEEVGMPPVSYLNDCRLTVASALILGKECSVSEAASAVGFADPLYFSRLFKRKYGVPPSRYL